MLEKERAEFRPSAVADTALSSSREKSRPLSWKELVAREPRLAGLLAEARSHHQNQHDRFCANAVWYGYPGHRPGLKRRLAELVGWESDAKGILKSRAAYDVAYKVLYEALPDCRHPYGECGPFLRESTQEGTAEGVGRGACTFCLGDIPAEAVTGTADPDTPIPVTVGGEETTIPLSKIMPRASRHWKGRQVAGSASSSGT